MASIESILHFPNSPQKGAAVPGSLAQMSHIITTLGQQQHTLQGILEMQTELQRLFIAHTREVQELQAQHTHQLIASGNASSNVVPVQAISTSQRTEDDDEVVDPTIEDRPSCIKPTGAVVAAVVENEEVQQTKTRQLSRSATSFKKELKKKAEDAGARRDRKSTVEYTSSVQSPPSVQCGAFAIWMKYILIHRKFDMAISAIVFINILCFFTEIQFRASFLEFKLGYRDHNRVWETAKPIFIVLEGVFSAIYLAEVSLQAIFIPKRFFKWNLMHFVDVLSVLVSAVASFILVPLEVSGGVFLRCIKLLRVLRLLRLLKVLRRVESLYSLRVLIKALSASLGSLFWSMMVLAFVILSAAMVMTELTSDFLEDESKDAKAREWVYEYFGSFWRASYTMFEATFSGIWASRLSRPLTDYIGGNFRFFWVAYIISVNFAVVRVIGALFLKQTLDVAAIDKDKMAAAKLEEREKIHNMLEEIFRMGDESGDGEITREEFEDMMEKDEVLDMFAEMELEPVDVFTLYNILCEDDGVADQQEFLSGAIKLKTQVRTVDMIQLLHEQLTIKKSVRALEQGLSQVDKALHPRNPWVARH